MPADALVTERAPFLSTRMVEWLLVAALILTLIVGFMYQVRAVQRQAELAAVRTTLGALRTALILQHLRQQTQNAPKDATKDAIVVAVQHNPFELLERRPGNYWGEESASNPAAMPPGSWLFDADCRCIAYLPGDATAFDSPSGDAMAWYHISGARHGPMQITPREAYVWQGEPMN